MFFCFLCRPRAGESSIKTQRSKTATTTCFLFFICCDVFYVFVLVLLCFSCCCLFDFFVWFVLFEFFVFFPCPEQGRVRLKHTNKSRITKNNQMDVWFFCCFNFFVCLFDCFCFVECLCFCVFCMFLMFFASPEQGRVRLKHKNNKKATKTICVFSFFVLFYNFIICCL